MTALNYVNSGEKAFILMDRAFLGQDRCVTEFGLKIVHCPKMKGAVAATGHGFLAKATASYVSANFNDIDHLADFARVCFPIFVESIRDNVAAHGWPWMACEILVVGWSERRQAVRSIFFGSNLDELFWIDERYWFSPSSRETDHLLHSFFASLPDMDPRNFDPVQHGLPMIKGQRLDAAILERDGTEKVYSIGGAVDVTEITASGVTTKTIHRWPEDRVGERIQPRPAPQIFQQPKPTLNRAARRRLAALA